MNSEQPAVPKKGEAPLHSWKEIGAYIQRNAVTARRWEKEEGLPVHRHSHKSRSSVYAYPSEIDAWRVSRKAPVEEAPPIPVWRSLPAVVATLAMSLLMVGNGPRRAVAQDTQTIRQVWADSGAELRENSLSGDGRYLTFVDQVTGDVGIRDLSTGTSRILTKEWRTKDDQAHAEMAIVSPDNRQVAYYWGMRGYGNEVRVIRCSGGEAPRTVHRLLYNGTAQGYIEPAAWSPDGKRLLVSASPGDRTTYQIGMISLQDGVLRVIKSVRWANPRLRLSPDGRYIAYQQVPDGKTSSADIYVIATDGSQEFQVAPGPSNDVPMAWSPDGSRLLFLSDRTGNQALWSVPIRSGKPSGPPEIVRPDVGGIRAMGMTRDGSFYYATPSRRRTDVHSVDLDRGVKATAEPRLVTEKFLNSNFGTSLSPDGRSLAYYSRRPGTGSGSDHVLVIRILETGQERDVALPLPLIDFTFRGPMWFPDGHSVLAALREQQKPFATFYRVNLESGDSEKLYHSAIPWQSYSLSPDGKAIYFSNNKSLFRLDLASRRETVVRQGGLLNTIALSPDGKQIAYLVSVQPEDTEVYLAVMPSSGGEERELFRLSPWSRRYNSLTWTPDQQALVFGRSTGSDPWPADLWRIAVAGGQPERVGVSGNGGVMSMQIQPDGKRMFFSTDEPGRPEVWAIENFLPKTTARR